MTETPPSVTGKAAADGALCGAGARFSPKMLTYDPGESTALEDAPFRAVKITGCAAAICAPAPINAKITICFTGFSSDKYGLLSQLHQAGSRIGNHCTPKKSSLQRSIRIDL